jgi:hypothetical protein
VGETLYKTIKRLTDTATPSHTLLAARFAGRVRVELFAEMCDGHVTGGSSSGRIPEPQWNKGENYFADARQ